MQLLRYLGRPFKELQTSDPFVGWPAKITHEDDTHDQEVWYEFTNHFVEVTCGDDEVIRSIFLHRGVDESLAGIHFSSNRRAILRRFGTPAASGGPVRDSILGDSGEWDRFDMDDGAIHIQYRLDKDGLALVTLMHPDIVPGRP